jgi:DNA ligase-1
MLAATVTNRAKLRFPYLASPKLDGIRCLIIKGAVLSRSFKPIRNKHIVEMLQGLPDLDGELICGAPNLGDVLNRTTRGVMSEHGEPSFQYHVFDTLADLQAPFYARLARVPQHPYLQAVPHAMLHSLNDLGKFEEKVLADGYEGVMLRGPGNTYKCGRATATENSLWKLKQFMDGELLVSSVREGVTNINYATKDNLGRTTRSTHQDGMIPSSKVGTIIGTDLVTGQVLEVSPGKMTHSERELYWRDQGRIIDKIIKYKCFNYGSINAPRFATFQAFRDPDDM